MDNEIFDMQCDVQFLTVFFPFVDNMTMEKVSISGPPPPARLDHAMCTVHLVITTASADCHTPLNSTSTDKGTYNCSQ